MIMENPSRQVVEQRIRNRIIEYLEMLCRYHLDPPPWDLNETVNQWEDWVQSPAGADQFKSPTYSPTERKLLLEVDRALSAFCGVTPTAICDGDMALQGPEWTALIAAAGRALQEFSLRGRLSEDAEFNELPLSRNCPDSHS